MAVTSLADGVALQLSNMNAASPSTEHWMEALKFTSGRLFFGFFTLLFLYNAYQVSDRLSHQVLSAEERHAIEWAKANTELDERFLILDEEGNPLLSPLTEWFPALAERRSVATIQGTEWLSGKENYNELYEAITDIHQCLYQDVNCLLNLQDGLPDNYDYILLAGKQQNASGHPLLASLKETPSFTLVYASPNINIFKVP
ncbi:MAG: hypothetical protein JNM02_12580 [Anaerolineales bacterium]|nr:hypothetical protein [Anaerolineales bacterium]